MKIEIPVAACHEYNTARYVKKAFLRRGHDAEVITQGEFYEDRSGVDLFFCVDSAGPLNFPEKHLSKTAMWFIDSRHNNDPARRTPDDDTNARRIHEGEGWVFQAQKPDWVRGVGLGIIRSSWLPLAADPEVWYPHNNVPKEFDVAFGGNVWCEPRRLMLDQIGKEFSLSCVTGTPEELAFNYSRAKVGFNVSSFFDRPEVAFDINMRVFEVMSCGVPLVTNKLLEMTELGFFGGHNVILYEAIGNVLAAIHIALGEHLNGRAGDRARELILDHHTYFHRVDEALEILLEGAVVE